MIDLPSGIRCGGDTTDPPCGQVIDRIAAEIGPPMLVNIVAPWDASATPRDAAPAIDVN
jgi:hypothetical protein